MIYIKKDIIGNYFESAEDIALIPGYEDAIGTTWEDYMNRKFILLSAEQIVFRSNNPTASVQEVFNMKLENTDVVVEPERTLDDAKRELHEQVEDLAESLRVFYVNGQEFWFGDRPALKLQIDTESSYNQEYVTIYDDNGNPHTLSVSEANDAVLAVEHYNTQIQDFVQSLHNQIETIPSLEFADSIVVEDYIQNAPAAPEISLPDVPPVESYDFEVTYKYSNAYGTTDISSVRAADTYSITIYPDNGYMLKIDETLCVMDDIPMHGEFDSDILGRIGYASAAHFDIDPVMGPINIVGTAYPIEDEPEQQNLQDICSVTYKITDCHLDNNIYSVPVHSEWKTGVYPNDGLALYLPDFRAEMGGQELKAEFGPDDSGRPDYASYALVRVDDVIGDIFIAALAR